MNLLGDLIFMGDLYQGRERRTCTCYLLDIHHHLGCTMSPSYEMHTSGILWRLTWGPSRALGFIRLVKTVWVSITDQPLGHAPSVTTSVFQTYARACSQPQHPHPPAQLVQGFVLHLISIYSLVSKLFY